MKTLKHTLFLATILVLALSVVLCFDMGTVADASGTETTESFFFTYENGEFILTRNSNDEEIYRESTYVIDDIVGAIRSIVGEEGDYDLEIPSPTIAVTITNGGTEQVYSKEENRFSFTATATHPFDNVPLMSGYSKVDTTSGYNWSFSRNDGGEAPLSSHGQTIDFGRNNAYGSYDIFASAAVSLELDGRVFTAEGKSDAVEIEIQKAGADDIVIDEDVLVASNRVYGATVADIIASKNIPGNLTYALELATDVENATPGDTVLEVNGTNGDDDYSHGVLVYYVVGEWHNGEFIPDESVDKVLVVLNITIIRREVRILINNQKINIGDELSLSDIWQFYPSAPGGVKSSDLGLSFAVETEDGSEVDTENLAVGQYYVRGSFTNQNYNVIFLDYENKDDNSLYVSQRGLLIVRPVTLTAEDDNFKYTLQAPSNGQFELGDELVIADGRDGGKTVKVKNGENAVEYDRLTLVIERKSADVASILIYIDGQWKEYKFDENGKITLSYSTVGDGADNFAFKMIAPPAPEEDKTGVIVGAVIAMLAGLFLCIGVPIISRHSKKKEDDSFDICDDDSVDPLKESPEENTEDGKEEGEDLEKAVEEKDEASKREENVEEPVEKAEKPLTLEEKYALHPEFVPTPSVEDAFKGVEGEDNTEDEKEIDEQAEEGKITFKSKMLNASVENRAIYNALKNNLLSYKGVKSRVVNGGDYFRRPGKQIVKIIFIGKTIRLALALNPDDYDYNIYHQKNRGTMKKYFDTPMFVKVQSLLGVRRAMKLISDLMEKEGLKPNKKHQYDDHLYNLTYNNSEE